MAAEAPLLAAGRLREGVSEREAAAEIEVIANRLKAAYPATNKNCGFHIERAGQVNPGVRKMIVLGFLLLLGAAALVLCTSCANVANLLLARASSRQREIATRIAIGAGRMRLVRQLLTESLLMALLGGAGGYAIAPRFFETFGIRMLEGEDFRPGVPAEDVVIANQALAETAFSNQNPIGRRIFYSGKMCRIIGLAATIKSRSIGEDPHPSLFLPIAQNLPGNDSLTGITLVLRTRGDPAGYAPLVRQMIREIDPTLALFDVRTMEAQLSQALFLPRAAAFLFGFAGIMGLFVATIGLYGVISFSVARRTKEIGIRMALGARRLQVLGMVLKHGILLTVIGSAVGLGFALALSRITASLLYGVSPTDIPTFVGVLLLLLVIALLACLVPAQRAASLDPNRALRCE